MRRQLANQFANDGVALDPAVERPQASLRRQGWPPHQTALIRRRAPLLLGIGLLDRDAARAGRGGVRRRRRVVVYKAALATANESVFKAFEKATGKKLELRGGTAPELFERLRSEGAETPGGPARHDRPREPLAREGGLTARPGSARPCSSSACPEPYRDPDGDWYGLKPARPHADALDRACPRTRSRATRTSATRAGRAGSACARPTTSTTSRSSPDTLAKRGPEKTRGLLESWIANEPRILGSDVDVLEAIAAGRCDVGLTNHYYLARELKEDPDFPVAPAWPDQDGAGAHTNLSGVGLVRGPSTAPTRSR